MIDNYTQVVYNVRVTEEIVFIYQQIPAVLQTTSICDKRTGKCKTAGVCL
jgi:hypothetical protein